MIKMITPHTWLRIKSALVLAPLALWMIFYASPDAFHRTMVILSGVMAWEWCGILIAIRSKHRSSALSHVSIKKNEGKFILILKRVSAYPSIERCIYSLVCMSICHAVWIHAFGLMHLVSLAWFILIGYMWALYDGLQQHILTHHYVYTMSSLWIRWGGLLGYILIIGFASAAEHLRDVQLYYFFYIVSLVWVVDIAAYIGGRLKGRRLLFPAMSPKKTWEGVYAAYLLGWVWMLLCYSVSNHAYSRICFFSYTSLAIAVSIIGDLFESYLKRMAGLKDSGCLIPGHGGVLDRLDGLMSALPVFSVMMFWS